MRVSGIPYVQGHNDYEDGDGHKYAIAIHNTSNDASDEGEANYAKTRPDGVSSHFYADRDSVIQSLDTVDRAGHAGSRQGNENAIAVEITGGNGKSRQWWLDNVCWDLLGRVLADVCRVYGIPAVHRTVAEMKANPKVRGFYGHNDMRVAWGGTTHTDPGPNFPWDRLLAAVSAHLGGSTPAPKPPAPKPSTNWTETIVNTLPTLKRGAKGSAVKRLQALLNVAGQRLAEDGDFGPATDRAVRAEQSQARIGVDGIAGRQTWSRLLGV